MNKITANFHKEMEVKVPKTKKITVTIENEDYEIVLKNMLNMEERVKLIDEAFGLVDANQELDEVHGAVLLLMTIYKAVTDIEFPEEMLDQIDQFNWLLDTGVIKEIENNLRIGLIEELSAFLMESLKNVETIMRKKKAEMESENSPK